MSQAKINPFRLLGLALIGSVLLWLGFPPMRFGFVMFIAMLPILYVEDHISTHYRRKRGWLYLITAICFVVWNAFTTYWIWFASPAGSIFAIVANGLLMTIPVMLFHSVKRKLGKIFGYIALICFWISLEMLQLNWDAPWPWLNLGNAFATLPGWIQWYEYTGALGGTLWIWLVNILIFEALKKRLNPVENTENVDNDLKNKALTVRQKYRPLVRIAMLILFPILISLLIKPAASKVTDMANAVAVQPNIDPYNDKFDTATFASQISTLINLSEKTIDSNTIILAWPETAIAEQINEEGMLNHHTVMRVHNFIKKHPRIKLITGISSYTVYPLNTPHTLTARMFPDKTAWYDVFNTAALIDKSDHFTVYHKSRLVPGVEKMPYPGILGFMEKYSIDEGGASGSLGSQDTPTLFKIDTSLIAAPVVCYESIFGEHIREFVKKGADVIVVITNDGWWKNSPGYWQHLYLGSIRAIETRRFVVRAANTGISCFIDPDGTIKQATSYWVPDAIKAPLIINHNITFYTRFGDYIGWIAVPLAALFYVFLLGSVFIRKRK